MESFFQHQMTAFGEHVCAVSKETWSACFTDGFKRSSCHKCLKYKGKYLERKLILFICRKYYWLNNSYWLYPRFVSEINEISIFKIFLQSLLIISTSKEIITLCFWISYSLDLWNASLGMPFSSFRDSIFIMSGYESMFFAKNVQTSQEVCRKCFKLFRPKLYRFLQIASYTRCKASI